MKLIIQIPCYNEEKTLPLVLSTIPKEIEGVDEVETMIIDDGSTDKTISVAKKLGVKYIIRHRQNAGLAQTFADGIHAALKRGADIIVNTDGDNQYPQEEIPRLIKPILDRKYDIVVADRQTDKIKEFSKLKKILQKAGSKVVQLASDTNIPDAPSGFRAYSRRAAMALNIVTSFSYVTETIIQAGKKRIAMTHIKVRTNPKTRDSRLFKSMWQHVRKTGAAIVRSYTMYEPFKVFLISGLIFIGAGTLPFVRFLYLTLVSGHSPAGMIQSLLFGGVVMTFGFMLGILGVVADLISINRKLLEDALFRIKRMEYGKNSRQKSTPIPSGIRKKYYSLKGKRTYKN